MKIVIVSVFYMIFLLDTIVAWSTLVPDTGLTKCYNNTVEITCPSAGQAFFGQDASYAINSISFTKLDSSGKNLPDSATSWVMVKDNVTGLIWENKQKMDGVTDYNNPHDADNTYTWYFPSSSYPGTQGNGTDTKDFIDALNNEHFGGYSDWRLPTVQELAFLAHNGIPTPGPTIETNYFLQTQTNVYWSSTAFADNKYFAWGYNFKNGGDFNCGKYQNHYVRAVRGTYEEAAANDRYVDNNNGTIFDKYTGLIWQQVSPTEKQTWEQALSYCENLTLGNKSDWRLPNQKELRSLVDYSKANPSINIKYFPTTFTDDIFWSSTTTASTTNLSWGINFLSGNDFLGSKQLTGLFSGKGKYYVRAVRTGQPVTPTQQTCKLLAVWSDGISFWNPSTKQWTKIPSNPNPVMIETGLIDNDKADNVIAVWSSGLYFRQSTSGQWTQVSSSPPDSIAAGDLNGDGVDEIIASWKNDGVYYWDSGTGKWSRITTPARKLAAGNISDSTRDDMIGVWDTGLFTRNSMTGSWQRIDPAVPICIAAGDMTGDKRSDIIASYASGTWYRNSATGVWTKITSSAEQLTAGDLNNDGRDDIIGVWSDGIWVRYEISGQWQKISSSKPLWITTGKIPEL